MQNYVLTNALVVTVDANHSIFENGFVAVSGNKIAAIGSMNEVEDFSRFGDVIDCSGHAVLPGLIDAHGHGGHSLIRSLGDGLSDWEEMAQKIYYECTDDEFWRAEAALAAAERIKFGTTTAVSMIGSTPRSDYLGPLQAHFEGAIPTGIREFSGIGCPYGSFPKHAKIWAGQRLVKEYDVDPDLAHSTTEEAVRTLNGVHPRQKCIVAPGRMGFRPDEDRDANIKHNRIMFEISEKYGVPLHAHAYDDDVEFMAKTTPEVLTPNLSLTHSIRYPESSIDILARTGTWVFHGPTTNMHTKGHCPVYEMLKKGVNVAIVSDGSASSRSYDLWRDMKNMLLLQRFDLRDTSILSCGKALEMTTIEPAKALGIDDEVGSLEVGKKADIITLDILQPHLYPMNQPVTRLVNHAQGQDVDMVIIDGEIVMKNRRLTKVDEFKILDDAKTAQELMLERLNRPEVLVNPRLYSI